MTTLAVDPGTTHTAWLIWDPIAKRPASFDREPNDVFLRRLRDNRTLGAAHLAVEMIASYGMPVGRETFETTVWIGRFVEAWTQNHVDPCAQPDEKTWSFVYRKDVKLHLCGTYRAKDPHVRQALIDRVGAPGTKRDPGATYGISGDVWSAPAVALYATDNASHV